MKTILYKKIILNTKQYLKIIGTTIKWSAVYRGAVRVFALGSLDESNN